MTPLRTLLAAGLFCIPTVAAAQSSVVNLHSRPKPLAPAMSETNWFNNMILSQWTLNEEVCF